MDTMDQRAVPTARHGAGPAQPLRIAEVAPVWMRIPPESYGGTEMVVHLLTDALVCRGYDVTLFASGDSQTRARLHEVVPCGLIETMGRMEAYEYDHYANHALAEAVRRSESFDVIHCHLECRTIPIGVGAHAPVLHTLHAPPSVDDLWLLRQYPDVPVSAISHYQAASIAPRPAGQLHVVHHGIDVHAYEPSLEQGRYLAFLGRMGPQKSPADAIRIAKEVGMPLLLAGEPQNASEAVYFAEQVLPHVDGQAVRYVGAVGQREKVELLRHAAALLFPIQGEEAFGLAMIEAMACGTPVVACARASVRELIDVGITGFYAEEVDALPALVACALRLDRQAVRRRVKERFSVGTMVDGYIELYESLVRRGRR